MPLTFRTATAADIPLLRALADRIWRSCYPGMINLEQIDYMLAWMYSAEKIADELSAGVAWKIVELAGEARGFLSISVHAPDFAELNKLYLLPENQGCSHGQAMLAHSVEFAAARGCAELRLRVNKGNARALLAYERAGFRIVDSIVAEIGGGFVMDDYILSRAV